MTEELLNKHTSSIEQLTLIPSGGGAFEVIVGGDLIYSKHSTGRHAEPGEILGLFEEKTGAVAVPAD